MKPAIIAGIIIACVVVAGVGGYLLLKPEKPGEQPPVSEWEKEGVIFTTTSYYNPEVVRLDNGSWRMYFENYGWIYSAISADGRSWTMESGARIQGGMPGIIKLPDSRWRLYFQNPVDVDGVGRPIVSAISRDGLSFEQEDGYRLAQGGGGAYDSLGVRHPTVIRLENGAYRMYYDGEAPQPESPTGRTARILSAYSEDGLSWVKDGGVRVDIELPEDEDGMVYVSSPHIFFENGVYSLYFMAAFPEPLWRNGIYVAISTDGLAFSVQREPVVHRDKALGDDPTRIGPDLIGAPTDPCVVRMLDGLRLYYWIVDQGILSAVKH